MNSKSHPCMNCGACCAKWRVSFYWREADPESNEHPVPLEWVEDQDSQHRAMKGSNSKHSPRCQALQGRIGEKVQCKIYTARPSPCRAFQASFENGVKHPRCDEARSTHGIKPLTRRDWINEVPITNSF